MRGEAEAEAIPGLNIYTSAEDRISSDHPLRAIKRLVTKAVKAPNSDFERLYNREDWTPDR